MGGDVFWIKLQTSTFDSETIMLLESMPEGDSILIIWFKMQILAGKCNADGYLLLNDESPYSDEMLATVFRRPLNTVRLAIAAFLRFKMVEIIDGAYFLPEWEKHQNVSGLEKIREQTRQRVARHRGKQKDVTLHVTHGNAAEKEIEIDKQQQAIRLLLRDTPLNRITDQELRSLADRHGGKQSMLAADIAAETWLREKKEIPNPGGYLQSLCSSLVVPSWYRTSDERKAKAVEATERQLASRKVQEEKKSADEKEAQAREEYWTSISETERNGFRLAVKEATKSGFELPGVAIAAMAKILAWERRSQMNT